MKESYRFLNLKAVWILILASVTLLLICGCEQPFSIAMHDPVNPAPGDQITYTLEMQGKNAPKEVKLFEKVTTLRVIEINIFVRRFRFVISIPGAEVLLNAWANPAIGTLSFARPEGIPASCLITYRFEVKESDNDIVKHEVTYASNDYPLPDNPTPVYITGNVDNHYDIVFIPDTDIANLNTFRDHCRKNIREAFFDENITRWFRHSFNFYINRQTGHATDYDRIDIDGLHQTPTNNASLAFAEGQILMHQNNLRDYAFGNLFSTEMQNRGTILHEGGHSLFGLADEYDGGAHWQAATLPNNWNSQAGAEADAPNRGRAVADVKQIGASGWYKICCDTCQMNTSGLKHKLYCQPCANRVIYSIIDIGMQ